MVSKLAAEPDVRGSILAAATRLLAARGFDGTTIQDIADAVGVTKPAVIHHFGSKEELRRVVLDAMLEHWKDTLPRLLRAATAGEARFDAVLGELHSFFAKDPDRARIVLREALDRPIETRKLLRAAVRPWLFAVAEYIRRGQAAGIHFREADAEAYVILVMHQVIASVALAPVSTAMLQGESRDVAARYDGELTRIARASLFPPETLPPKTRARKAPSKR